MATHPRVVRYFTTHDGARLCYELHGDQDAPRMLLVQGSMADIRRIPDVVAVLSQRFRLCVYDHRGMGRSFMDQDPEHYSMAGYAADADALLEHLGWDRCHIFGFSFGGMVAQEIALRYPVRLSPGSAGGEEESPAPRQALILACTSAGGESGASVPLHELVRGSDFTFLSSLVRAFDTNYLHWPGALVPLLAGLAVYGMPSLRHIDADARHVFWNVCRHLQFNARAKHNTTSRFETLLKSESRGSVRFRTLVVGGDRDGAAPKSNVQALAELIPGAELRFFPGGHMFFTSNPTVLPFLCDWVLGVGPTGPMQPPPPAPNFVVRHTFALQAAVAAAAAAAAIYYRAC